jgi:glycine dehydrogenase subunit 1
VDYAPHTDEDVTAMLGVLGLDSIEELFAQQLPADLRAPEDLGLAAGLAEADVLDRMRRLAAANTSIDDAVCWLGGGAYDHYQPAVVPAIVGKPEFATAYTPYQPEMSQGGLQALFEFQTLASEVLGLPIANSSLYDGASAIVEAVIMAVGSTGRSSVVLAGALDPRFREILATYAAGLGVTLVEAAPGTDGTVDPQAVAGLAGDAAAVVVQHPNVVGVLEDVPALAEAAHGAGAKLVVSFDLMLAGVLEPPGRLGADIVTADGLSSGNSLSFGGPGCGLLACSATEVRRLPGRLVGQTVDLDGRRGFVLTLQAREQHIRREKATSNICTNQALNAMAVAVYLSWLGPQGLVELGEACLAGAAYAAEQLAAVGVPLAFPDSPVGKEFALGMPDPAGVQRKLAERGHLVGPIVNVDGRELLLVAVTEQRTKQDVDDLARACRDIVGEGA